MKHAESTPKHPERVIAYIDGFNLYFGLRDKGWKRFLWLNIQQMSGRLLKPDQVLVSTKYFTSRIGSPPDKADRQNLFLEAIGTLPGVEIFYGNYQVNPRVCSRCRKIDHIRSEKMTDVNIATEMLTDAFLDKFDTAILISADGDLKTPVVRIAQTAGKRVIVVFPPERKSYTLQSVATATMFMGRAVLANSQFPEKVIKADGFVLERPKNWV
jgi:uncharacterized LabA/DUF88 family protein